MLVYIVDYMSMGSINVPWFIFAKQEL